MKFVYLIIVLLFISNLFFVSLSIKKGNFSDFRYLVQKSVELKKENQFKASTGLIEHQKKEIELLKYFIELCKTHQIKYVAFAGTLLGAVRHKGFIPWDDDIDLALSDENIVKLRSLKEEMEKNNVYIDFAPRKKKNPFRPDHNICQMHYIDNSNNKKDIYLDLFNLELKDNLYSHKNEWSRNRWPKEIYTKEEFEDTIEHPFGDIKINIPKDHFKVLRRQFGDWENLIYEDMHQF